MLNKEGAAKIPVMQLPARRERTLLALILTLYLLLGLTYALTTPAFEASDELWHFPMVRHLADGNPLPVQVFDPAQAGPWNQEASQPPLYYYLGAALTYWVDQSDMEAVRRLNPHVDTGVITSDGNINLVIHDPDDNSWQGTLLAVRLVRLFSVLLGTGTVFLTYLIALEVAPGRSEVALAAAALNAFLPMFLFISGSVNNDNLAMLLASLAIWLMIRVVTKRDVTDVTLHGWKWLFIGIVIGLAVLTKEGTLGLIPMALGTAVVSAWQGITIRREAVLEASRQRRGEISENPLDSEPSPSSPLVQMNRGDLLPAVGALLLSLTMMALPILAIAGWWYYRNIVLYGDWLGWNAFIAVLGQRAHPASLTQLWGERHGFMMSYWGLFGGVNVPMSSWVYSVLNVLLVSSIIGFVYYFVRLLIREWRDLRVSNEWWLVRLLRPVVRNFGLIVILLFSGAVVFGLIQWATTTWSSQGRLVFTAISALSTLMALGLAGITDAISDIVGAIFPMRGKARIHSNVIAPIVLFLLVIAAVTPFLWIQPSYRPPALSNPLTNRADLDFGARMRLSGYEVLFDEPQPGDTIRVLLEWEVMQEMDRDWSVFVHLNDPVLGRPIAQRDMFPGRGLLATRLLEPGQRLVDEYVLEIPPTAIAPAELELVVGLYDYSTGERLEVAGGQDSANLGTIPLTASEGPYPNPVSIFFEQGLELIGFEVEPRRTVPEGKIEVKSYWRPTRPLPADFTFFAQVIGQDTTRFAAADVVPPVQSSDWLPGQSYEVNLPLSLDPATLPDAYPLIIGLYTRTSDGGFDRLQLVTPDGRLTDDFLVLTQVKVDAP
jgi:hypothetical protein